MSDKIKKSSFSGSIGFVLAAAGSAVGLGNLWRLRHLPQVFLLWKQLWAVAPKHLKPIEKR